MQEITQYKRPNFEHLSYEQRKELFDSGIKIIFSSTLADWPNFKFYGEIYNKNKQWWQKCRLKPLFEVCDSRNYFLNLTDNIMYSERAYKDMEDN